MKVIAINASPRADGNTASMIRRVLEELRGEGVSGELIQLAGKSINGCKVCGPCWKRKDERCAQTNDMVNEIIAKIQAADGLILGSPTYFATVTTEMKALIDRIGSVAKANGDMFARKVGAAVVAKRRGGAMQAFNTINAFFLIGQMIIPGSCYWNMGIGLTPGEVEKDEEGMRTMAVLGKNMAWLLKRLQASDS